MGSRFLGGIITRAFYCPRLWEWDLIAWLSGDFFSFRWIALPADTISSSRNRLFLNFDVFREAEEWSWCSRQEGRAPFFGMWAQPRSDRSTEYSQCLESEGVLWGRGCQLHAADVGAPRCRKIKRQSICLSRSGCNDHVIHDDDDHNDDNHGDNNQYDLVRGPGPSIPTEENAQFHSRWRASPTTTFGTMETMKMILSTTSTRSFSQRMTIAENNCWQWVMTSTYWKRSSTRIESERQPRRNWISPSRWQITASGRRHSPKRQRTVRSLCHGWRAYHLGRHVYCRRDGKS